MKKFEGFIVDGKPFFPLGAQAHNSSSYSRKMFEESCRAAKALRCNTVEAPLYWEKVESREGIFDFSALDYMLELCRASDLRLVILWFGSWKNGDMSYAPEWVKRGGGFQRVLRSDGVPVADLSAHYRENQEADARAFAALCAYLKKADSGRGTVIALQVENEPGYLRTDRDYSPRALEDQKAPVPEKLLDYLETRREAPAHGDWEKNGKKRRLSWVETFGFHGYEYCEAWYLARYIDAVAAAGKEQYRIPLYVNVWLNAGSPWGVPGMEYPGGGAVIRTRHIWLAAVEHIDMLAPDIYEQESYRFEKICDSYNTAENALFIPESARNYTSACNMFYAIARGAVGYATFGSESCLDDEGRLADSAVPVRDSNAAVISAMPLILKHRNTGKLYPVVKHSGEEDAGYEFEEFLGNVHFGGGKYQFYDYSTGREKTTEENMIPRGLIIEDEPRRFYLAGRFSLRLALKRSPEISKIANDLPTPDFISVEEGHFDEKGSFVTDRVRNGDEAFFGGFWVTPNCGLVRIVLV
ncbi:MAG: DUF5597 domain-containing protein [Treponema sp.]|jgi:hypothetical protein|nr:DUF5597 domain-containing protein [Treponema sp.]